MEIIVEIVKWIVIILLFIGLIKSMISIAYLYDNNLLDNDSISIEDVFLSKKKIKKKYSSTKEVKQIIDFLKLQKSTFNFVLIVAIISFLLAQINH